VGNWHGLIDGCIDALTDAGEIKPSDTVDDFMAITERFDC